MKKRRKEKRKTLLDEVQVHVLSSEVSISNDDGAGQLSNLRAIALIENETRRYDYNLKNKISTPNNILPFRQEKAKAKKRKRRYPSYGHISGEYTFTTQSARFHVNHGGGSTNYSCLNPAYSQHYSYYKLNKYTLNS